jgi:hypothetical protein
MTFWRHNSPYLTDLKGKKHISVISLLCIGVKSYILHVTYFIMFKVVTVLYESLHNYETNLSVTGVGLYLGYIPKCLQLSIYARTRYTFGVWLIWMGWDYVSELLPLTDILYIPQMIRIWRARVEWRWRDKTEELEEKPVPVPPFYHCLVFRWEAKWSQLYGTLCMIPPRNSYRY